MFTVYNSRGALMTLTLVLIYQLTALRKRGFDFEILFGYYFHLKLINIM